jgi:predicted dehydrogenase
MRNDVNRRSFLKRATLAAGAVATGLPGGELRLLAAPGGRDKLNCAQIGCGTRGMVHLEWLVTQSHERIAAVVEPDETLQAQVKRWLQAHGVEPDKVRFFTDYRPMFDKLGGELDAVFIATPNHHHAPAARAAMQLGRAVYCEKPLCHDIAEARQLRQLAAAAKAPTQMGIQGHCHDGYRRLCEFVWGGVVGPITETHSWTNRANGGSGGRPATQPAPAGLHWEEWIGPAPFRAYHPGLHPHGWHGWYAFGNGSLGNMGCHVLDGVFWALKLEHPLSIELESARDGSNERFPTGSRVRWDFPARGGLPPVKVYWYEGLKPGADPRMIGKTDSVASEAQNFPPLLVKLREQYPEEDFDSSGTIYVGEKGILYTGTYGDRMHVLPREKMEAMSQPPRQLPRPKDVMSDFVGACRQGQMETAAGFDYGARLTEFTFLGNLAQRAGAGVKLNWDGPAMKVTNHPEFNEWIQLPARKGWSI